MFSMEDRKVYIVWVKHFGNLQDHDFNNDEGFSIIPIHSGFRDKDRLTVEFTTPYEKFYEAIRNEQASSAGIGNGLEDRYMGKKSKPDEIGSLLTISLLQKQIVSMTFLDGDVWEKFEQRESPAPKDQPVKS